MSVPNVSPKGVFSVTGVDASNLNRDASWTNPNLNGLLIRASWEFCEPAEKQYNWANIDAGVALAKQHNKPFALSFAAGLKSPLWIYDAGVAAFEISGHGIIPSPWNATFTKLWRPFAKAAGNRYADDPLLAYVTFSGLGRAVESHFVSDPVDCERAMRGGFSESWTTAGSRFIDFWSDAFPNKTIALAVGNPYPGKVGKDAMTWVSNYGISAYGKKFALKTCALSVDYPSGREFAHTTIPLEDSSATFFIYQMLGTVNSGRLKGTLEAAIQNGLNQKAHCLEIYTNDANRPEEQGLIARTNEHLLSL